jgi:hypothetical protein
MCLDIDEDVKTAPKKKIMWKVVNKDMRSAIYTEERKYVIGKWFKSNRKSKEISPYDKFHGVLHRGIHVFTTRRAARLYARYATILKVEVNRNDWVASGYYDEAVYMKVKPISIER